jgi:LysR family glycine cleavage system transcriptional activator
MDERRACMSRTLPPLHALRVFEAASRHLSFTRASAELNLTQGAVSRQVRRLEEFIGRPLFTRLTRRIELTDAGQALLEASQQAFDDLERTLSDLRSARRRHRITLGVLPTIGSLWLMPRLVAFAQLHPDIDIRLVSSTEPAGVGNGELDLAVRCGAIPGKLYDRLQPRAALLPTRNSLGVRFAPLFEDRLMPVLSRALAARIGPMADAACLSRHRLIHTDSRPHAWPDWLAAQGIAWRGRADDIGFGHFFMALQAARESRGIALLPTAVLACTEPSNELVCPLPAVIASAADYCLLMPDGCENSAIQRCARWLIEEATRLREKIGQYAAKPG